MTILAHTENYAKKAAARYKPYLNYSITFNLSRYVYTFILQSNVKNSNEIIFFPALDAHKSSLKK